MAIDRDSLLRATLRLSAVANTGVAVLMLFPGSTAGQLAGLPAEPVPLVYRALLALFIAMFGAAYAWLARQARISPAFIAYAATGKFLAFAITFALWTQELSTDRWTLLMTGDLAFAAVFTGWLLRERAAAAVRAP